MSADTNNSTNAVIRVHEDYYSKYTGQYSGGSVKKAAAAAAAAS